MTRNHLVVFVVASAVTAAAAAAPKGAPVGYEKEYKAVLDAEQNGEYERALGLLDQIPSTKHTVFTRLKRAGLLVRLGRFVEAEVILVALADDPAADSIRATVISDLEDVRARMPKLTIRLSEASKGGAWVTVDDKHVGPPVTLTLNPGTHVVVAKKGDTEVFRQKVTLLDGQKLEIEIDASAAPAVKAKPAPVNPPPVTPAPLPSPAPNGPSYVAPFVVTGLGVVALGVGGFFGFAAKSKLDASKEPGFCNADNRCTPEGAELRNASLRRADLSTWFFIGGSVLAVGGLTWTLVTRSRATTAQVGLAPGGLFLVGTFQ